MFHRLEILLDQFNAHKFCEVGLALRLRNYAEQNDRTLRPSRKQTVAGMTLVSWEEP